METKKKGFKGKAIYNPSGKAREYSYWAFRGYRRCYHGCTYCYLNKGVLAGKLGSGKPEFNSGFKSKEHLLEVFEKEIKKNVDELQKHGLFFSFTTDPLLKETVNVTDRAISICMHYNVPVKVLTKRADWIDGYLTTNNQFIDFPMYYKEKYRKLIAFGFTLTGHDELEPNASTNAERIEAMRKLHEAGFKTFASIEPIIDFESSYRMIYATKHFCDLYKIGLMSGQKVNREFYEQLRSFNLKVVNLLADVHSKVYWKESIRKNFSVFPDAGCNVTRDYNLFK